MGLFKLLRVVLIIPLGALLVLVTFLACFIAAVVLLAIQLVILIFISLPVFVIVSWFRALKRMVQHFRGVIV